MIDFDIFISIQSQQTELPYHILNELIYSRNTIRRIWYLVYFVFNCGDNTSVFFCAILEK